MRTLSSTCLAALALCALVIVTWSTCPSSVSAQTGYISGPLRLEAHLDVDFFGGLGPGMRLDVPLLRNGLIPAANDELALTLGADVLFRTHHRYYDRNHHHHPDANHLMLLFPIALQWNFMLPHNWTVFPEVGLALVHHYERLSVLFDIAAGARWHFGGGKAALLLRLTYPGGFQAGLTW